MDVPYMDAPLAELIEAYFPCLRYNQKGHRPHDCPQQGEVQCAHCTEFGHIHEDSPKLETHDCARMMNCPTERITVKNRRFGEESTILDDMRI
jgi:hypothetical protein